MTGSAGLSISAAPSGARWVGRSGVLLSRPDLPHWVKSLVLTSSFFGLQLVWSCEMAQASPFLLSLGVSKSMMAVVFVAGPLSGLVAQPLVGVFSDSCKSKFGRRRPFIFGGVIISSLSVILLGWAKEVASVFFKEGGAAHQRLSIGFAILAVYLVDFSVNVVQAMDRSLLVDVIPPSEQASANAWAARMFGFGAVFGYGAGTLDLVSLTGGVLGDTQLKVIALFTVVLVCATHAVTLTCVEERVLISKGDEDDPRPKGHSATRAVKEIWHTIRTIPKPIQSVFNVQFTSWLGWFPVLFFTTTWIAEIYVTTLRPTAYSDLAEAPIPIQEDATRAGTTAMFYHSVVAFLTSILLPPLISPTYPLPPSRANNHPYGSTTSSHDFIARVKRLFPIPIRGLTLPLLWTFSTALFGTLLLLCSVISTVAGATVVISLIGFNWACTNWIPFAVLADLILRSDSATTSPSKSNRIRASPSLGSRSIMLHSSRSKRPDSRSVNASTSTTNVHTIGSSSSFDETDSEEDGTEGKSKRIIDLDRTPRPVSTFVVVEPPSRSPYTLSTTENNSHSTDDDSGASFQDLPSTPATTNSTASAYFDLPSPSPSSSSSPLSGQQQQQQEGSLPRPSLSTPPLVSRHSSTLSPITSPNQPRIEKGGGGQQKKKNRGSVASSSGFEDYPPNNGDSTFDFYRGDEFGRTGPISPSNSSSSSSSSSYRTKRPRGNRHDGSGHLGGLIAGRGGGGGASTSTIKLGLEPDETTFDLDQRRRRTIRIRHSDELSSFAGDGLSSEDEDRDGEEEFETTTRTRGEIRRVPKIRVGQSDRFEIREDSEDEDDDGWLNEEHLVGGGGGTQHGGTSGGDQAGVILGCHNIYLVLPQFLVTALSSIIFAILDPRKSVLGSHAPPSSSDTGSTTNTDRVKRFVLHQVASALIQRQTQESTDAAPTETGRKGYNSLSLIFQIGGVAALVSTYICFRLWRDSVRDGQRISRTRVGYARVNS